MIQVMPTAAGELTGLVRHVGTGEKRQFAGLEGLSEAIRGMVQGAGAT